MKAGKLEQFDTPQRVFDEPASEYVAAFIGMGNRLELTRTERGWSIASGEALDLGPRTPTREAGERAVARLRAEDLHLRRNSADVAWAPRPPQCGVGDHRVRRSPLRRARRHRRATAQPACGHPRTRCLVARSRGGGDGPDQFRAQRRTPVRSRPHRPSTDGAGATRTAAARSVPRRPCARRCEPDGRDLHHVGVPDRSRRRAERRCAWPVADHSAESRGWGPRLGYTLLMLALGYLVVLPLIRLQSLAFEDGAAGYQAQYGRDDTAEVIWTTVQLALGSLVIAMVLGTVLAFATSRLPARFAFLRVIPVLPIVMPAVANICGWAFLLSSGSGYLNALLRQLPWWNHLDSGPVDVYTPTWIIILTGFGLTSFVYLFVSAGMANISAEHLEAAQASGSSTVGVFFRIVLPAAASLAGLRRRGRAAPRARPVHRAAAARLEHGRQGPDDRDVPAGVGVAGGLRRRCGRRVAAGDPRHRRGTRTEGAAGQPEPVRHPRRQRVQTRSGSFHVGGRHRRGLRRPRTAPAPARSADRRALAVLVGVDQLGPAHPGELPGPAVHPGRDRLGDHQPGRRRRSPSPSAFRWVSSWRTCSCAAVATRCCACWAT